LTKSGVYWLWLVLDEVNHRRLVVAASPIDAV